MYLANILTVIRIIFIPIFIGLYYFENSLDHNNPQYVQTSNFYSYLIFTIAAVTDLFDGWIARKYKQMTKFGAFLDPVADKLIVCSALVLVVEHFAHPNPWIKYSWILTLPALIIIAREILISALREWMAELSKRAVVSVSWIGKWKTKTNTLSRLRGFRKSTAKRIKSNYRP